MELKGKVAIITGSSKGIGASIAKELAAAGVKVVVNYNSNKAAADAVVDDILAFGGTAFAVKGDVSVSSEASELVEATIDKYGQLDILVNNAGITRDRTFKKLDEENWRKVMDVNLNSVFNTTSAALSHLTDSGNGRIINISSIIGQTGAFGQSNYAASKAGMIGFTKSLALELARTGVTVNAICPGYIETEMYAEIPDNVREQIQNKIPTKRLGHTNEIARAVLYLCQDGEYITGQQLNINGGLYM